MRTRHSTFCGLDWPNTKPLTRPKCEEAPAFRQGSSHSLPESQRYATNDAEYTEIHRRHLAILETLIAAQPVVPSDDSVLVLTATGSFEKTPPTRESLGWLPSQHWISTPTGLDDDEPDFEMWVHLYVTECSLPAQQLTRLLRMVADDQTHDVIITARDLSWLYHPYDGGGDVIAPSVGLKDALKEHFADWLPETDSGL